MDLVVADLWVPDIAARLLYLNNKAPHVAPECEDKASTDH